MNEDLNMNRDTAPAEIVLHVMVRASPLSFFSQAQSNFNALTCDSANVLFERPGRWNSEFVLPQITAADRSAADSQLTKSAIFLSPHELHVAKDLHEKIWKLISHSKFDTIKVDVDYAETQIVGIFSGEFDKAIRIIENLEKNNSVDGFTIEVTYSIGHPPTPYSRCISSIKDLNSISVALDDFKIWKTNLSEEEKQKIKKAIVRVGDFIKVRLDTRKKTLVKLANEVYDSFHAEKWLKEKVSFRLARVDDLEGKGFEKSIKQLNLDKPANQKTNMGIRSWRASSNT
jgi:hypothetical protein